MRIFRKKLQWLEPSFNEIKKRSRILVIDDADFPYIVLFKENGYAIDHWKDVENLTELENGMYDIILLDIQGVGKSHSPEEQGFGILKHLKKNNPMQIIIAYSNADYSLKYHEFFRIADIVLSKTNDYFEFKSKVDDLLKQKFSLDFYINRIVALSNNFIPDTEKLKSLVRKAILNGQRNKLKEYLEPYMENNDIITTILSVVQIAVSVFAAL